MLKTHLAIIKNGKIQIQEPTEYPEGTKVLVTVLPENEDQFWFRLSQPALDEIWGNHEDDIYELLLQK